MCIRDRDTGASLCTNMAYGSATRSGSWRLRLRPWTTRACASALAWTAGPVSCAGSSASAPAPP
eukprot:14433054-Alexandrium_andersonii.AAC.1